jgi:hypothetical protein
MPLGEGSQYPAFLSLTDGATCQRSQTSDFFREIGGLADEVGADRLPGYQKTSKVEQEGL